MNLKIIRDFRQYDWGKLPKRVVVAVVSSSEFHVHEIESSVRAAQENNLQRNRCFNVKRSEQCERAQIDGTDLHDEIVYRDKVCQQIQIPCSVDQSEENLGFPRDTCKFIVTKNMQFTFCVHRTLLTMAPTKKCVGLTDTCTRTRFPYFKQKDNDRQEMRQISDQTKQIHLDFWRRNRNLKRRRGSISERRNSATPTNEVDNRFDFNMAARGS